MILREIQLFNYKNHRSGKWLFSPKINAITGKNGSGKTNILEAIYYWANAKSYYNSIDQQLIQFGEEFFTISGKYEGNPPLELLINFGKSTKKSIKRNGKPIKKILDHIGQILTVFITPNDISIIHEGSEERRRFIDFTISQLDSVYLKQLVEYRKVVEQRNHFLKQGEGRMIDDLLLESFDAKLIPLNERIFETRKAFLSDFLPYFNQTYQEISDSQELAQINYISSQNDTSIGDSFAQNKRLDMVSLRTTCGIHKDDLDFNINDLPVRKFGSQGQIKSFVIALKIAQYEYLKSKSGQTPILLLDDIFEKIDETRSNKLMAMVCGDRFGQIFVSDTSAQRVREHFNPYGVDCQIIEITPSNTTT